MNVRYADAQRAPIKSRTVIAALVWTEVLTVTDCTKCIHEQVCDQASRLMWSAMAKEAECSDFKDRTEYVEMRHGQWEHGMQCPYCKQIDLAKPNYCSNCGAKTDAEVEGCE